MQNKFTPLTLAVLTALTGPALAASPVKHPSPQAWAQEASTSNQLLVSVDGLGQSYEALRRQAPGIAAAELKSRLLSPAFVEAAAKAGLTIGRVFPRTGLVELTASTALASAMDAAGRLPGARFAAVNHSRQPQGQTKRPNDLYYSVLWGLDDYGQHNVTLDTYGLGDRDINAPEAWAVRTDTADVVVAVLDTGADINNADIHDNIWVNPTEIPYNGIDDDNNGYVDDINGIGPAGEYLDMDPVDNDLGGHGSAITSIIGAVGNNGEKVTGVAWHTQMMPIKVVRNWGAIKDVNLVEAIEYVLDTKARLGLKQVVMNLSFGSYQQSQALTAALAAAADAGVLIIAAAGNAGQNNDHIPFYPASSPVDAIVSVGGSGISHLGREPVSNKGCASVDVMAPGEGIVGLAANAKDHAEVSLLFGTSGAAALVSGVAALTWAQHPEWDWREVKNALLSSSKPVADLQGDSLSQGIIKADLALGYDSTRPVVWGLSSTTAAPGSSVTITGVRFGQSSGKVELISSDGTATELTIDQWQDDSIKVLVPDDAPYGASGLVVSRGNLQSGQACLAVGDQTQSLAHLAKSRSHASAALLDGALWVFGGEVQYGALASVERVDLASHRVQADSAWTMPQASSGAASAVLDGKVYLAGGFGKDNNAINNTQIFDPNTQSWSQGAPMPGKVGYAAAAAYQGKLYVLGGLLRPQYDMRPEDFSDTLYIYDPKADSWTTGPSLPKASWGQAASVDPRGQGIVVAGGFVDASGDAVKTVQLFDPRTGSWQALPDMLEARSKFSLLTHNDAVYALFGWQNYQTLTLDSGEILVDGQWHKATQVDIGLNGTAVVQDGEQAFIVGGEQRIATGDDNSEYSTDRVFSSQVLAFNLAERPQIAQPEPEPTTPDPEPAPLSSSGGGGAAGGLLLALLGAAGLRRKTRRLTKFLALGLLLAFGSQASEVDNALLLVKIKKGVSDQSGAQPQLPSELTALLEQVGGKPVKWFKHAGLLSVEVHGQGEAALKALRQSPLVQYAEPSFQRELRNTYPNDPELRRSWGLDNYGQQFQHAYGLVDRDINAPEAWDIRHDADDVVVAIIDGKVDTHHPELVDNLWINPGEIAGNGLDDDGNGYIDDIHGIDLSKDRNSPVEDPVYGGTYDPTLYSHATAVAGIIGAKGDNDQGVAGVAWRVKLMPLAAIGADDFGLVDDGRIVEAIEYLLDTKERLALPRVVLNMSWGSYRHSQAIHDALQAAQDAGVLMVAAAGNSSLDEDTEPTYPANDALAAMVAVGGMDSSAPGLMFTSDYGCNSVDLLAPSFNIYSLAPMQDLGYSINTGNSMATAYVSGISALIWAQYPTASALDVKAALMNASEPMIDLTRTSLTQGMVRADKALDPGVISNSAIWDLSPMAAGPGRVLTLSGHHFGDQAGQVKLIQGEQQLTMDVLSWRDDHIEVRVPVESPFGQAEVQVIPPMAYPSHSACFTVAEYPEQVASSLSPRIGAAYTELDGNLWLLGGEDSGAASATVERVDTTSLTVSSDSTWALPSPLTGAKAVSENGLIYLVGGFNSDGYPTDEVLAFNPATPGWQQVATLPHPLANATVVVAEGKLVIMGGQLTADPLVLPSDISTDVVILDLSNMSWSQGPNLPQAVANAGAEFNPADGTISLYGGYYQPWENASATSATNAVWHWAPGSDSWAAGVPMIEAREGHLLLRYKNEVYALFGRSNTNNQTVWGINTGERLVGDTWQQVVLGNRRLAQPAGTIAGTRFLVVGGVDDFIETSAGDEQVWQVSIPGVTQSELPPTDNVPPEQGLPVTPLPESSSPPSGKNSGGGAGSPILSLMLAGIALWRRRKLPD